MIKRNKDNGRTDGFSVPLFVDYNKADRPQDLWQISKSYVGYDGQVEPIPFVADVGFYLPNWVVAPNKMKIITLKSCNTNFFQVYITGNKFEINYTDTGTGETEWSEFIPPLGIAGVHHRILISSSQVKPENRDNGNVRFYYGGEQKWFKKKVALVHPNEDGRAHYWLYGFDALYNNRPDGVATREGMMTIYEAQP